MVTFRRFIGICSAYIFGKEISSPATVGASFGEGELIWRDPFVNGFSFGTIVIYDATCSHGDGPIMSGIGKSLIWNEFTEIFLTTNLIDSGEPVLGHFLVAILWNCLCFWSLWYRY